MSQPRLLGPWSRERIDRFLHTAVVPLRLGCLSRSGAPLVLSHWFAWRDGALWCATAGHSQVAGRLRADPRCAFEVATNDPPYQGVRGQGRATLVPERGEEILRALIHRYLGGEDSSFARWLLDRAAAEVAIRIDPRRLRSWDFTRRMTR